MPPTNYQLEAPILTGDEFCAGDDHGLPLPDRVLSGMMRWSMNHRSSSDKRQREFQAGRKLVQGSLLKFGCDTNVGRASDRSPIWPDGFVGSISHSDNWVWGAVAKTTTVRSIGIDTEPVVDPATRNEIAEQVATTDEWALLSDLPFSPEQIFTLTFSAKEAFYKCWYPQTRKFFGFEDARIDSVAGDSMRVKLLPRNANFDADSASLDVFYHVTDADVFTATWLD